MLKENVGTGIVIMERDYGLPGKRRGDLFKLIRTVSSTVEPSDNGAYTCAGYIINWNPLLIKSLENTYL